ncbi:hypothetical protein [Pseudomonas sp. UBA1879]|uniref:hypothetical protein n=1 Tax=Pseudomonas sp. UBA1879 TaxID=1947305 RepID=UPI0025FBA196|nr:hypothetical protein [Pseudomonas sp. UBA1879]
MSKITDDDKKKLAAAFSSVGKTSGVSTLSSTQQNTFPAPTVTEAPSGTLNPLLGASGVHVEVAYPEMNVSDIIGLSFNGNDTFDEQNGSMFGKVTFAVPVEDVVKAIGKTVDVVYAVVRPAGTSISQYLKLTVTPIPENQLAGPQIAQASGGTLDVTALTADADVTVSAWPLIAVGQRLWLKLEGSTTLDLPAWQGYAITSTGVQSTKIPQSFLKGLTDGSSLKLVLEVSFDGGTTRQAFPLTTYAITAVPPITSVTIDRVTDSKGFDIPNGGTTTDTSVTIYGSVA